MRPHLSLVFIVLLLGIGPNLTVNASDLEAQTLRCLRLVSPPSGRPFQVLVEDPVAQLKRTQREAEAVSRAVMRTRPGPEGPDTEEFKRAFRDLGNSYLRKIKDQVNRLHHFLELLLRIWPDHQAEVEPRIVALRQIEALLPAAIDEWKKGKLPSYLQKDSTRLFYQVEDLLKTWVSFQNETMKTADLIRLIRQKTPGVIQSSEFQKALQSHVLDGVDFLVQQSIVSSIVYKGEEPVESIDLYWLFHFILPGWHGLHLNLNMSANDRSTLPTYHPLFINLVSEIIRNANEATHRRYEREGKNFNFNSLCVVSVQTFEDGIHIRIEDSGDPSEYTVNQGLGMSSESPVRSGFGIGRFRTYLLAQFLGFAVSHHAKPDGSGSMVEIIAPVTK